MNEAVTVAAGGHAVPPAQSMRGLNRKRNVACGNGCRSGSVRRPCSVLLLYTTLSSVFDTCSVVHGYRLNSWLGRYRRALASPIDSLLSNPTCPTLQAIALLSHFLVVRAIVTDKLLR